MANSWNESGTTWGTGRWGTTAALVVGWGAKLWNSSGSWGEMGDETVSPTGVSATFSIGSVTVDTEINSGWGRQAWNDNAWGIQGIVLLDGQSATTSVGSISPADVMGLTGVSATASVGSPTIIGNVTIAPTGISATISVGTITPADVIGLTGVSSTASVGSLSPADVMELTGVSATVSLGTIVTTSNPTVIPTGISATASVAGFGTATGFGIQAYQAVDTGSNTTYSDVA